MDYRTEPALSPESDQSYRESQQRDAEVLLVHWQRHHR